MAFRRAEQALATRSREDKVVHDGDYHIVISDGRSAYSAASLRDETVSSTQMERLWSSTDQSHNSSPTTPRSGRVKHRPDASSQRALEDAKQVERRYGRPDADGQPRRRRFRLPFTH